MTTSTDPRPAYMASFDALSAQLQRSPGHRLFTVSRFVPGEPFVERIYSSVPDAYPLQGRKPTDQSEWSARMARGVAFVANRPEDFGPHFSDLAEIVSHGLGAVINMPVMEGALQLGTLNLLDAAGAYGGPVLPACEATLPLARLAFAQYTQYRQGAGGAAG